MITLYHFGPIWGLPDASPFCCKIETYLRMANIPYQVHPLPDLRKTPKGKLPYIEDSDQEIADSSIIIDYLKEKFGDNLDTHLTPLEKAQSLAFQRLIEEHLYWIVVYARWVEPEGWNIINHSFFGKMPFLLKQILPPLIRRKVKGYLHSQGLGRHSRDEIYDMGKKDIDALATLLGDKLFFFGEETSSFDAIAFSFLANIVYCPVESPLKEQTLTHLNLVNFCKLMRTKYYKN